MDLRTAWFTVGRGVALGTFTSYNTLTMDRETLKSLKSDHSDGTYPKDLCYPVQLRYVAEVCYYLELTFLS